MKEDCVYGNVYGFYVYNKNGNHKQSLKYFNFIEEFDIYCLKRSDNAQLYQSLLEKWYHMTEIREIKKNRIELTKEELDELFSIYENEKLETTKEELLAKFKWYYILCISY